jgi:hypothetical protein
MAMARISELMLDKFNLDNTYSSQKKGKKKNNNNNKK